MERHWAGVQDWLGDLLIERGVDRISAEELTVPPGMDELFSLLRIKAHHKRRVGRDRGRLRAHGRDAAPAVVPRRRALVDREGVPAGAPDPRGRAPARALAARHPAADQAVFEDIQRLSRNLIAMNEILRDRARSTIRLVMNPDKMVIGEAMRTFTYLNLYGYLTDAVVVNRVFPADVGDYFAGWRRPQEEHLELVESAFAPVPVLRAPYFDQEVVGAEMLDRLARRAVRPRDDPAAVLHDDAHPGAATCPRRRRGFA